MGAGLAVLSLFMSAGMLTAEDGKGGGGGGNNNNNASEVRLRTQLAGAAITGQTPSGHADFRLESSRNRSRLNVEVEHVNLQDGTMLDVAVVHAGVSTKVGTIKLKLGFGELELNSQDGDTVPAVVSGDMVTVSNAGSPILSGVF